MMSQPEFEVYGYVIGGKMVVGRAEMTPDFHMKIRDGDYTAIMQIKEKLTRDLVQFILENKLVEFTQYNDPITQRSQLAVRAYLAPSDQVKILRLANKVL